MKELRRGLIVICMCLLAHHLLAQTDPPDTVKKKIKKAPDALIKMVKEFERQKGEAKKKIDARIVDPPAMEIDGIVMDETMSKAGRDFYEVFFSIWVKPKDFKNYYIKIKERPFRMNSTLIEVYVSDVLVYQAVLKRRYDDIVDMVKLAKGYTLAYINKLKQEKINLKQSYF